MNENEFEEKFGLQLINVVHNSSEMINKPSIEFTYNLNFNYYDDVKFRRAFNELLMISNLKLKAMSSHEYGSIRALSKTYYSENHSYEFRFTTYSAITLFS